MKNKSKKVTPKKPLNKGDVSGSKSIFAEMKKLLSKDDGERFEQITKIFKDTRAKIIKAEGKCDDEELAMSLCKNLGLKYDDYCALSVWSLLN